MESKIAIGTIRNNQEPSLLDSKLDEKPCTEPKIRAEKAELILDACRWRDVSRLRSLADGEDGLLTDALRREAWPILLGLKPPASSPEKGWATLEADQNEASEDWRELPRHREEDQVALDVNRSFIYYPSDQTSSELEQRKSELSALIFEVLRRYPYLCYFQGFHDICQVFLLVLNPELRAKAVARLAVLRIRDFMLPTLGPTTSQLKLLPDILARADPKLRRHLAGVEPFYALAGTLTLYSHNIEGYQDIARLFDVILAREPVFSVYMFAQIVMNRRDELYEFDDPDMLHVILGKVPPKMNLNALITDSVTLFERYPPEILRGWPRISSSSVLKTARNVDHPDLQTLEEGRNLFEKQAREIRWVEVQDRIKMVMWAYRGSAKTVGLALAVGAFAFYLRRNPTTVNHVAGLFSR